ncbi:MAG: AAA family ATPase [Acetobacter sp.]
MLEIFAKNYRGFKDLSVDLTKTIFLVGDNSSGKSSFIYLIDYVIRTEFFGPVRLETDSSGGDYDFFSPYFDNDDVTIGFKTKENDSTFYKLITISKMKGFKPPLVKKITCVKDDTEFSILHMETHVSAKFKKHSEIKDIFSVHANNHGYRKIDLPKSNPINTQSSFLGAATSLKHSDMMYMYKTLTDFLEPKLDRFRVFSSLRANPSSYYDYQWRVQKEGNHFASILYYMFNDWAESKKNQAKKLIISYGKDSGLFDEIDTQQISTVIEGSPIAIFLQRGSKKFSMTQVGFGVSQSIPIVVELAHAYLQNSSILFGIQQPEVHLHPKAQAAMGGFLFEVSNKKLNIIVETHSDFIIDRFRSMQKKAKKKVHSEVLFFEHSDAGNTMHKMTIADDGTVLNQPDAYRDFFIKEYMKTL